MNTLLFSFPMGWQWIMILLFFLLPAFLCVKRAAKLNRSQFVWGILGLIFSYIAVLIIYVLGAEPKNK